MYDLVGDRIRDIFDAQVIAIGIVNRDTGLLDNPYMFEKGARYTTEPMSIEGGPTKYVLDTGETLVINERFTERANELGPAPNWGEGGDPLSAVYVPLVVGGEAIGRITLQNMDRENAFTEADVSLLTTLAGSLSVALDNARLFEETRQRNAELALINDVQRGLGREPRDAGDVRPRRRAPRADLRCTDGRHRGRGHGRRSDLVPILDRARRSADRPSDRDHGVPQDRARDARTRRRQRGHGTAVHRGGQPARDRRRTVTVVRLRPPADREPRDGRDLAPQPRSRTRVQRGRRPSAHDARRQPERWARERPAVRGDGPARGRARDHQQRRPGAGRTARARRADRAPRRPAP